MAENPTPDSAKKAKACGVCHARKIRCDLQIHPNTQETCSNCRNAGKVCQPHVRKRKHDHLWGPNPESHSPLTGVVGDPRTLGRDIKSSADREADTPSRQQASYLGRSHYITAHFAIDEDDATRYQSPGPVTGPAHDLQTQIQRLVGMLDLPRGPLRQTLVKNFLKVCRPWMPLMDEADLKKLDTERGDSLLMVAVLVAGSVVSSTQQAAEVGQRCYQRAKVLFYTGAEQDNLQTIMATIFLQWLNPCGAEHVSIDSSTFWLRISVGLAHQIGLHREPDPRLPDAKLRRKIWWTLVSRDNQISASHGRPRAINTTDSNVRQLRVDDFDDFGEDSLLFMHFVRITSILGELTEHYCRGTLSDRKRVEIEEDLLRWLKEMPASLELFDRDSKTLKEYNFKSRQLHVPYFVALIMLFRQDKTSQPPSAISSLAASFISGIFEEYLTHEDVSHLSPTAVFYLMVAALLQLSYHRFPPLDQARSEELQIITLSLNELKRRFPTAMGTERVVNQAMKHTTAIPVSAQPIRMAIPPEQRELVSSFGPELCRHWSVIFNSQNEGTGEGGNLATTTQLGAFVARIDRSQDAEQLNSPDSTWGNAFQAGNDDAGLFMDLNGFDTVGKWWWADWVPDGETDLLYKGL